MTEPLNKLLLDDGSRDPKRCGVTGLLIAILLKYGLIGLACVYLCIVVREKDQALAAVKAYAAADPSKLNAIVAKVSAETAKA